MQACYFHHRAKAAQSYAVDIENTGGVVRIQIEEYYQVISIFGHNRDSRLAIGESKETRVSIRLEVRPSQ